MTWLRLAVGFVVVAAVGLAAAWVADNPGFVTVNWQGWQIELPLAIAAVALAVLVVALNLLYLLWRGLVRLPATWRVGASARSRRRALQAFTDGMIAIAAGDAPTAERAAQQVAKLSDDRALNLLIGAQAAQLAGDDAEAEARFRAMLDETATKFLGLRGLTMLARRRGDAVAALDFARAAFDLKPDAPWPIRALIDLETATGDWGRASAHLERAVKAKAIGAAEAKRKQAVIAVAQARADLAQGLADQALKQAEKAVKLAPDLTAAVLLEAELLVARNKASAAIKHLRAGWGQAPHPDIARACLALPEAGDAAQRLARAQALAAVNPDHPESRAMLAEAAIAAGHPDLARNALDGVVEQSPRVFRLRARLAELGGEGAGAVRQWLERAADTVDPLWLCQECGHGGPTWHSHCPACGAFDSLSWRQPAHGGLPALPPSGGA